MEDTNEKREDEEEKMAESRRIKKRKILMKNNNELKTDTKKTTSGKKFRKYSDTTDQSSKIKVRLKGRSKSKKQKKKKGKKHVKGGEFTKLGQDSTGSDKIITAKSIKRLNINLTLRKILVGEHYHDFTLVHVSSEKIDALPRIYHFLFLMKILIFCIPILVFQSSPIL